ncbi:DUF2061 domain-containing protein [archaeon]|jgi:uncharacterized membrane protein|nr:DUF2061 domain-containing protein [archaeon]MBT3730965.1 DUF2061 domain-containing protein [archaeon]MBT4669797.1 DUF2061 domain-containing protein [archaeon]MBT5029948.1 DUF2061 domain-containing protein [archaeon]MBT5288519.1 DUF2061 domain-containing protein [archaeon]
MKDGHRRSFVKTISYRFSSTILTAVIVFIFTRDFTLSLGVGAAEWIFKSLWYYFHERMWNWYKWGKH